MRFDRQIATARRLIEKNGQIVTWRQTQKGTVQSQPWLQQDNPAQDFDVVICFLPSKLRARKSVEYVEGPEVANGFVQGLMGVDSRFDPQISDVVIRGESVLRISSIEKLAPNGQQIIYTIEFDQ